MANQVAVGRPVPHGYNDAVLRSVEFICPGAVLAAETITVTLPEGIPDDSIPVFVAAHTTATPGINQPLDITSHNRTTGVTVLTAPAGGAGVAAGSRVAVGYLNV